MGVAKYKINFDFFKNKNEYYWYVMGLIASDGYVSDERIEIALNKKDDYMLEKIRDMICPTKPVYINTKTNSVKFTIHNKIIASKVKVLLGMTSNKKHSEMTFPNVPRKYMKDFIRGYIDGDGSIGKTKGYQTVDGIRKIYIGVRLRILGNENFLKVLIENIREEIPNKTYSISKRKGENVYEVTYNFSIAKSILHWLYDNNKICLERKESKFKELINIDKDIV